MYENIRIYENMYEYMKVMHTAQRKQNLNLLKGNFFKRMKALVFR